MGAKRCPQNVAGCLSSLPAHAVGDCAEAAERRQGELARAESEGAWDGE